MAKANTPPTIEQLRSLRDTAYNAYQLQKGLHQEVFDKFRQAVEDYDHLKNHFVSYDANTGKRNKFTPTQEKKLLPLAKLRQVAWEQINEQDIELASKKYYSDLAYDNWKQQASHDELAKFHRVDKNLISTQNPLLIKIKNRYLAIKLMKPDQLDLKRDKAVAFWFEASRQYQLTQSRLQIARDNLQTYTDAIKKYDTKTGKLIPETRAECDIKCPLEKAFQKAVTLNDKQSNALSQAIKLKTEAIKLWGLSVTKQELATYLAGDRGN